jgi:phage FluMu protein gp41
MVSLTVPVHVDEPGANNRIVRIDGALGWRAGQISDRHVLAVTDSDIARIPRRAAAINDVAVDDDEVKRRGGLSGCKVG